MGSSGVNIHISLVHKLNTHDVEVAAPDVCLVSAHRSRASHIWVLPPVGASCNHIWSAEGEDINPALYSPLSAGTAPTLAICAAGLGSAEDWHGQSSPKAPVSLPQPSLQQQAHARPACDCYHHVPQQHVPSSNALQASYFWDLTASGVAWCSFRGRERQDGDILLTAGVKNGEPPTVLCSEALLPAAQDPLT